MTSIIHYGNEWIELNGRQYSWEDFLKIEPNYSVPHGWKTRVYRRGEIHYISDGANSLALPKIWEDGDRICNREGELARLVAFLESEGRVS